VPLVCAAIVGTVVIARAYKRLRGLYEALVKEDPSAGGDRGR
jgi:hypothetical protein